MDNDFYRKFLEVLGSDNVLGETYTLKLRDEGLRKRLSAARDNHTLTLVLGAGASADSGLPDWEKLISNAVEALFAESSMPDVATMLDDFPGPIKARFCEAAAGLKAAFRSHLHRALYKNFDPEKPNSTLSALSEFILGLDNSPAISNVITYNFDNLLEVNLKRDIARYKLPVKIVSVYSEDSYRRSSGKNLIRIMHPHGFIPHDEGIEFITNTNIVFSEIDYHKHYSDQLFWANLVQLNAFQLKTCLFLGVSFTDGNMRRLLDFASLRAAPLNNHVAIFQQRDSPNEMDGAALKSFITERDLNSLNVNPFWIEQYKEIPGVLKSIR